MAQWIWALVTVIGIALLLTIVLLANRQRRSIWLRQRFGPEYTRTLEDADDRRAAEAALQERARRRSMLRITPLAEPVRLRYAEQWRELQEHFVDHPAEAVDAAEKLLAQAMEERGYPVGEFDQRADLISVDHPHVVENYRIAHTIHIRNQSHQATTEELREAMLRYRSLFDDLLRPNQNPNHDPS
jgi:glutathione S-transferase